MRSGGMIAAIRKVLAVIAIVYLTVACCPCRKAGASTIVDKVDRDSIYITHYDTLRIVERDTLWLERIEQSHDRVMVDASHSYLENTYCYTTADVNEYGILTHSLDTRDSALLPVRYVYMERVVRDTVYRYRDKAENKSATHTREVRKASLWQRTQIIALWVLLGVLAITYRRQILSLVKRIILWI